MTAVLTAEDTAMAALGTLYTQLSFQSEILRLAIPDLYDVDKIAWTQQKEILFTRSSLRNGRREEP